MINYTKELVSNFLVKVSFFVLICKLAIAELSQSKTKTNNSFTKSVKTLF